MSTLTLWDGLSPSPLKCPTSLYQMRTCHIPVFGCEQCRTVLRRKAKDNYKTENDSLFYHPRGGTSWKKVPGIPKERTPYIDICHSLPEGN